MALLLFLKLLKYPVQSNGMAAIPKKHSFWIKTVAFIIKNAVFDEKYTSNSKVSRLRQRQNLLNEILNYKKWNSI